VKLKGQLELPASCHLLPVIPLRQLVIIIIIQIPKMATPRMEINI
jgi:hypothetical protein